jgi:hypothetical protein
MKPYNDFTFVIQGPLHKNCIHGILNNYKEYTDNIIVSHWNNDDPTLLQTLTNESNSCKLISNEYHTNYNVYNQQNVYYQTLTTLYGIREARTQFVLKLRTDQWFGNLTPILDRIRETPEKLICANLHFRPNNIYQYHPSDKLYGGDRKLLEETVRIMYQRITNNVPAMMAGAYMYTDDRSIVSEEKMLEDMGIYDYTDPDRKIYVEARGRPLLGTIKVFTHNYIGVVPEVILGTSFLMAKGIYPGPNTSVKNMKENFDIVPVEHMTPYLNKNGTDLVEHIGIEIHTIDRVG